MSGVVKSWKKLGLIKQIILGLILGVILGVVYTLPKLDPSLKGKLIGIGIFGELFVGALKSVAPILVFFLVMSAISLHKEGQKTNLKKVISLYLIGTFLAGLTAVVASFLFPVAIELKVPDRPIAPPGGVTEVLKGILLNIVDNPINALSSANYIGILAWATLLGLTLKKAPETTKTMIKNFADALGNIVRIVISFAPLGIMGLVFKTVSDGGIGALLKYGKLLLVLLGCMVFIALVVNPIITYVMIKENPYPLVFKCLKQSGITAFFTRSSAANIPVNMNLCEELGLEKDMYSVSIPLGATINMAGAAITISVLTLAAVHTLGIEVDFMTALLLSVLAAVSACGASGVAGGSLLLIPLACSLFGISNDLAAQVVGAGFIIGVLQDSCETALNSSTDALFTAVAEFSEWKKEGKKIIIPKTTESK